MLRRSPLQSFLVPLLGTFIACANGVSPVGPSSDVTLVTSLDPSDAALAPLVRSFERETYTTRREKAFKTEFMPPQLFARQRRFRNLVLVAPLVAGDETAGLIREVVGEQVFRELETGARPFAIYSDVFAVGQTVIVIAAGTHDDLREITDRHAEALHDSLERRVLQGLGKSLYLSGERLIHPQGADWQIRIPAEYEIESDPARRLFVAHAVSPERWLVVESVPMALEAHSVEAALAHRRARPRLYPDEILVEEDVIVERMTFSGHDAHRIRGRWQSPALTVGGPFRLYAFHARAHLHLVELLVFLPGVDQLPYLRQLEAIAATFELSDGAS